MNHTGHRDRRAILADHLRNRLWVIPTLFGLGALLAAVAIARWFQGATGFIGYLGDRDSARSALGTISSAMLTFLGLVFSISVVALQIASGQLSPRVMRVFQRDRRTQVVLGVFLATFVFSLTAMVELGEAEAVAAAPLIGLSLVLVGASLVAFLVYLQHITTSLRAVTVIEAIAAETRVAIDDVYPPEGAGDPASSVSGPAPEPSEPVAASAATTTAVPAPRAGVIAAVDLEALAERARADGVVVRVVPPVGTYLPAGATLFEVEGAVTEVGPYQRAVDLEASRTLIQDVPFGIRQLVDIAERALSPAVNDPTTALQALDRIGDLLRRIVVRPDPETSLADRDGTVRVRWTVPSWEALVDLACNEIRWFGSGSTQVTRRMAWILADLRSVAPPARVAAIDDAARRLAADVARTLPAELVDDALAPDPLGRGGVAPR
ncbi:MAG: DUF2254 domain-containing protein [Acidimicrobiales bacterium]